MSHEENESNGNIGDKDHHLLLNVDNNIEVMDNEINDIIEDVERSIRDINTSLKKTD